jgi:hypothetical protein
MTHLQLAKKLLEARSRCDSGLVTPTHEDSHNQSVGFTHALTAPHHIKYIKHVDALFIAQSFNHITEVCERLIKVEGMLEKCVKQRNQEVRQFGGEAVIKSYDAELESVEVRGG